MKGVSLLVSDMPETSPNSNHSDKLDQFSSHCRLYYQTSLSFHDSEMTNEQKSAIQASKCCLDALEHQIANAHEESLSLEYREFLNSKEVKEHSNHLAECGLHITLPSEEDSSEDEEAPKPILKHSLSHQELVEYSKIRDKERRNAHALQMEERRKYLDELIKKTFRKSKIEASDPNDSNILVTSLITESSLNSLNSREFLNQARSKIGSFSSKYKINVGTHSFFAGIKKLIEKQMENNDNCILWTFNSSTLSEVNHSCIGPTEKHNGETYMDEAVELLSLFLVSYHDESLRKEIDENEPMYSFYIQPSISNSFLSYILGSFPSSHELHAKGTGTFKVLDDGIIQRSNANGTNDESIYFFMIPWLQNLRCEIL